MELKEGRARREKKAMESNSLPLRVGVEENSDNQHAKKQEGCEDEMEMKSVVWGENQW